MHYFLLKPNADGNKRGYYQVDNVYSYSDVTVQLSGFSIVFPVKSKCPSSLRGNFDFFYSHIMPINHP